jgi:nicotinamidase-related amidase
MTMLAELVLPGRYYRMYPRGSFLGFVEEELRLPLGQTAVLAVDIYGDTADDPDVWSGLISAPSIDQARVILRDRVAPVLDAARSAGVPVIYAANSAPRIGLDHSAYGELKQRTLAFDTEAMYSESDVDGLEYVRGDSDVLSYTKAVAPRDGDYFVRKHVHSAFFDTRLDTLLRNLGVRHLVCVGFTLDVCLGTTMIDAVWRNYRVVLLRDCTYAIELPGIDTHGSWTERWITYAECNIGHSSTAEAFVRACAQLAQ